MRKKLIAGNWKMNLHWNEAMSLVADLVKLEHEGGLNNKDIAIFPPHVYLRHAFEFVRNAKSAISVGAQNCASTNDGAYTGEISAAMIRSIGAEMVLIGHSERRSYFMEDSAELNAKLKRAFAANLTPVFCCGEELDERQSDTHFEWVEQQLEETILQLADAEVKKLVIAYEPVWAIGTGETATPQQAQEMHAFIRNLLERKFGKDTSESIRILYGGSMKPDNAKSLLNQPDVDGGLIGGASLSASQFYAIISA